MEQSKMVIVEGPQGTGKTTLANYLRDNIAGANLYRLSGQKDKTLTGLNYSIKMYQALLDYLKVMQSIPMDIIFDRTYTTEEVYGRLGYKDYSFTDTYNYLTNEFNKLNYEIYYFSLYLKNIDLFKKRLDRKYHHNYQSFSVENSYNQQNTYLEIADELDKYDNINVYKLSMDDFDKSYDKIKKILRINGGK